MQNSSILSMVFAVGVFLGLFGAVWLCVQVVEWRRRWILGNVAAGLGMRYAGHRVAGPREARRRLPLFWYGTRQQAKNLLRGRIEDLEAFVFDYQYTVDFGTISLGERDSSRIHAQTVAVFGLSGPTLPDFELRPREDFRRRARVRKGYHEIDFSDAPGFAERYLVRGKDAEAVRAAVTGELFDVLRRREGLCIDAGGRWVAVYRLRRRVRPPEIPEFLEEAFEACTRLA